MAELGARRAVLSRRCTCPLLGSFHCHGKRPILGALSRLKPQQHRSLIIQRACRFRAPINSHSQNLAGFIARLSAPIGLRKHCDRFRRSAPGCCTARRSRPISLASTSRRVRFIQRLGIGLHQSDKLLPARMSVTPADGHPRSRAADSPTGGFFLPPRSPPLGQREAAGAVMGEIKRAAGVGRSCRGCGCPVRSQPMRPGDALRHHIVAHRGFRLDDPGDHAVDGGAIAEFVKRSPDRP